MRGSCAGAYYALLALGGYLAYRAHLDPPGAALPVRHRFAGSDLAPARKRLPASG